MPPGSKKRKAQRRKKQQQHHHPHHPSAITPSSPSDSDSQQNPISPPTPPPSTSQGNGGSLHDPIAAHGTSDQCPNTTDGSSADDADAEKEPAAPTVETSVSGKGEERVDVQAPEISAAAEEKGLVVRDVVLTPPPYSELIVSKPEEEGTAAAPTPVDAKEIKDGEMESAPELVLPPSQVVVSKSKDNNSENKAVETSDVSVPIVQCDSVNEEVKQTAEDAALSSEVVGEVKAVESALESVAVDEVKNVVLEESVTEQPRGVEVPEKEMVFAESASEKPRETAVVGEVKEIILAKSAAEQPRGIRVPETTVVGETKEVVLADSATKQPREIELSETAEVIRAPLIQHRATWWNCCGLLDVLKGSQG